MKRRVPKEYAKKVVEKEDQLILTIFHSHRRSLVEPGKNKIFVFHAVFSEEEFGPAACACARIFWNAVTASTESFRKNGQSGRAGCALPFAGTRKD